MQIKQIKFPLTNQQFLNVIYNSFAEFIASETSRSPKKLKPLHGAIAKAIYEKLNLFSARENDTYKVISQGFDNDKEAIINGRYVDKKVDIKIIKNNIVVAGIAVKFVMQNYSQNSVNYFENMLGETANIRCNNYPYFQIFIVLNEMPYYDNKGNIKKWETFTEHNAEKYFKLSFDNTNVYFHTPNKTLIYIVKLPTIKTKQVKTKNEYFDYYKKLKKFNLLTTNFPFDNYEKNIIVNDFEYFINKVVYTIMAE